MVVNPDDFTFAVFGDNKGNHTFFDPLLRDIGRDREIVFAIDVGDLVGNGKRSEYRRFLNQVQKNLTIPFLAATGNHDFNNGFDHYRRIFGPTYCAFQVGQGYFIVLDATKESGLDKAERQWLEDELRKAQGAKARFIFMHIPPFDPRGGTYLPHKDKDDLLDLFRRYKVTHLFASHIHGYFSGTWEGIPYTITGGAGARLQGNDPEHFFHHYMRVHVNNGKVDLTVRRINGEDAVVRFFGFLGDNFVEVGLLLGVVICVLGLWFSTIRKKGGL
jgi:3',5'-cyclic AMP phosphodiesterase CpdA